MALFSIEYSRTMRLCLAENIVLWSCRGKKCWFVETQTPFQSYFMHQAICMYFSFIQTIQWTQWKVHPQNKIWQNHYWTLHDCFIDFQFISFAMHFILDFIRMNKFIKSILKKKCKKVRIDEKNDWSFQKEKDNEIYFDLLF